MFYKLDSSAILMLQLALTETEVAYIFHFIGKIIIISCLLSLHYFAALHQKCIFLIDFVPFMISSYICRNKGYTHFRMDNFIDNCYYETEVVYIDK